VSRRRRPVSLNVCTTMHRDLAEHVQAQPQTTSARRRRNLHRGALRFVRDVRSDGDQVGRVLLFSLTVEDTDPNVAQGAMRQLLEDCRDLCTRDEPYKHGRLRHPDRIVPFAEKRQMLGSVRPVTEGATIRARPEPPPPGAYPRTRRGDRLIANGNQKLRYFWWAEFQARGAIHFHGMLVDPPFMFERDARYWLQDHWKLSPLQPWVLYWTADKFFRDGGNYVLKEVRKRGDGKAYEQDYTRMPRGWRTFASHRLAFAAAEHEPHETKAFTVCTAAPGAPWYERQREVWIYRVDEHVPARCGCLLPLERSRRLAARPYNGRGEPAVTCRAVGSVKSTETRHESRTAGATQAHVALPEQAQAQRSGANRGDLTRGVAGADNPGYKQTPLRFGRMSRSGVQGISV
jgi:hypothetical protein